MPYRRAGLNKKDQRTCARLLAAGMPPQVVAKKLYTTPDVVKKFTREKIQAAEQKNRARSAKVLEETAKSKNAARAIAEASKEILKDTAVGGMDRI